MAKAKKTSKKKAASANDAPASKKKKGAKFLTKAERTTRLVKKYERHGK